MWFWNKLLNAFWYSHPWNKKTIQSNLFLNIFFPIFGIFIIIYIPITLLFLYNKDWFLNLSNISNITSILWVFIWIIWTIIWITFSILLVNIQSVSSDFSWWAYRAITNRKEPFYTFLLLFLLEFLLVIIYFSIDKINITNIVFLTSFFFFISLYVLWDFYIWVKINLSISNICKFLWVEFSKTIDNNLNNTWEELFNLLEVYSRLLDKRFIKDSYLLFGWFINVTKKFVEKNINNVNLASFLHNNIYMVLNRGTVDSIIKNWDYQWLNNVIDLYKVIMITVIKNTINNSADENELLSFTISQFNELWNKIISTNQDEWIFKSLRVMQEIAPILLETNYHINFSSFLDWLWKYWLIKNEQLKWVLMQEYIKVHITILNKIIEKWNELFYLYISFDKILNQIKLIFLYKAIFPKLWIDITNDLLYKNIFDLIRLINFKHIKSELDSSDLYIENWISSLLEWFVKWLEFYKQNKIIINDYLHIRYFCEMLLDMLEDEITNWNNTNFYLYFQTIERLSYIVIDLEDGRELYTINEYLIKILWLIIKYDLDKYELYDEIFKKLIDKYKSNNQWYKLIDKIYKELSLILVLLQKENKEFGKFKLIIDEYEKEENKKMKDWYDWDIKDIEHFLFPITRFILSNYNDYDRVIRDNLMFSSFNSFFDEWFIRRFNLSKDDFWNYLWIIEKT